MKKISLSLLFILITQLPVLSQINCSEALDLYKNNKHYSSVIQAVDKLKIMEIYPDHTFRGEKSVTQKEMLTTTLNILNFIESEKKVSLKKKINIKANYTDIAKDKAFLASYKQLSENYPIELFKNPENKISSKQNISMGEFNSILNQLLNAYSGLDSNPYALKVETKQNTENKLDNLLKLKIIETSADFKAEQEINRYELSEYVLKIAEYIKHN